MKSKNLHVGRVQAWAPALVWAAVIFALSSIPGSATPSVALPYADKIVHFAEYLVLGAAFAHALLRSGAGRPAAVALLAATAAAGYGVLDEVHQSFVPGREADWRDAIADALGAVAGASLWCEGARRRSRTRN